MTATDPQVSDVLKRGRGMLIFLGLLSIFFGMAAISAPFYAGQATVILVGSILLVSGVVEIIHAFQAGRHSGGVLTFLTGIFAVLGGGLVLSRPVIAMAAFTLMLAAFFFVDGFTRIVIAIRARPAAGWGLCVFNGVVTLALGLMIWRRWPLSGVWAIGVLIGIRILMAGWTMLFFSSIAGTLSKAAAEQEA
jgi:uncharacterized membrane protein HdeD (DUF308 family)